MVNGDPRWSMVVKLARNLQILPEMAVAAQNTNNSTIMSILHAKKLIGSNFTNWHRNLRIVLMYEKKLKLVEHLMTAAPDPETTDPYTIDKYYESVNIKQEVACLMLSRGWSVRKLLSLEDEKLLGHLGTSCMGKTIAELHVMLKLHEKGIPKKAETPAVLAIREGRIQKDKKKLQREKGYALEFAARILNMILTKKVDRTSYEIWHGKALKLSYLRVWGCEAYVKRDTPDKLDSRSINCIFVVYLKETMEASGSHRLLEMSEGDVGLELIQEDDTQTSKNTSKRHDEIEPNEVESQSGYWLCKCFSMKDLGEAAYILEIKIIHDRSKRLISLSQSAYFDKILKKFKMENSKRGSTPMQEKPGYRKSQGAQTPSKVKHMQNVPYASAIGSIIILQYLRNTKDMVLIYGAKPESRLKVTCYTDAGFQTNKDDTKSQPGYVFVLNEAEYIDAAKASIEAVWMRKFTDGLGDVMSSNQRPMEMLCDNAPAIEISNDPEITRGSRHYQKKYYYIPTSRRFWYLHGFNARAYSQEALVLCLACFAKSPTRSWVGHWVKEKDDGFHGSGCNGGGKSGIKAGVVAEMDGVGKAKKKMMFENVFIAKHKNKLGQMFGFCRYYGIDNTQNLIDSLNGVWIGKLRLHANIARFDRKEGFRLPQANVKKPTPAASTSIKRGANSSHSFVNVVKGVSNEEKMGTGGAPVDDSPTVSVSHSQEDNSKLFEGFSRVEIKYLGGLWVLFVFNDKHVRDKFLNHEGIQSWFSSLEPWKWGEVLFINDSDSSNRFSIRLYIKSSHNSLIFTSTIVTLKGVTYAYRVRELCSWTPNFAPEAVDTEEEGYVADGVNVVEEGYVENFSNTDGGNVDEEEKELMGELFCTHDNGTPHNKKENTDAQPFNSDPFDQSDGGEKQHDFSDVNKPEFSVHHESKSIQSSQVKDDEAPRKYVGVSMIQQVEDTIKVGIALGFNMDGCQDMLQKMIADMGDDIETKLLRVDLWSLRQKDSIICADNYVVVQGKWIQNGLKIMFVVVYAPQGLASKIVLWLTLSQLIANWDAHAIVMGDFNEVREAAERSGTDFNKRQAEIFNSFITNMNLFDVPLGGFRFTWTDKWASKMSKLDRFLATEGFHDAFPNITGNILEKGIPDHRPILLKEYVVDYGPTPFRFFHSWLDCEGFYDLVVDTWKSYDSGDSNGMISFKKKLQNLKQVIRTATSDDLNLRISSMKILSDIDCKEASDLAQKEKVKWALEGDENTSFFHGSLKKKRRKSAIKGILKNGVWIDDPGEILVEQREFLECDVSNKEIKRAVWDCGSDRAPGPDGRNIPDGPLVLNECMAWYRKRNKALMVFKVDFEKAFDSLRWDYLDVIMEKLGFGFKWPMWIYDCLKNSRASILINGSPTSEFDMFNGLRQGDPMSPFLFILAMEGLHALVSKAVTTGLYKGASIGRGNINVSHLLYTDDAIFVGELSHSNAYNLVCLLQCFYMVSGLKINVHKSKILGVNVLDEEVSSMALVLGCGVAKLPMMYLGVPIGCNMRRCVNWKRVVQKFESMMNRWKDKLLSVGGRLSLIKVVLGNLPTYYISLYWMPITVQKRLESMRNRFFIEGDSDDKKITWVKWNSCLASKAMGGLGIGSIFALNVALLFKWVWRFRTTSNSLWVNVIKDIHGHDGGIGSGRAGKLSHSPWNSII
ncbi:RNA-directed DNA polymerase, eukaryota [Tanacetum coccineum]